MQTSYSPSPRPLTLAEIRTLALASLGGALEFYDFVIFVFFTAVIGKLFFSSSLPEWMREIQTFGIFCRRLPGTPFVRRCYGTFRRHTRPQTHVHVEHSADGNSYLTDRVFANISCGRSGSTLAPHCDAAIARSRNRRRSAWRLGVCRRARTTAAGRTCHWTAHRWFELRNTAGIFGSSRPQCQVQSGRDSKWFFGEFHLCLEVSLALLRCSCGVGSTRRPFLKGCDGGRRYLANCLYVLIKKPRASCSYLRNQHLDADSSHRSRNFNDTVAVAETLRAFAS